MRLSKNAATMTLRLTKINEKKIFSSIFLYAILWVGTCSTLVILRTERLRQKNIHSGTKRRQTIANNTALKSAEQKPGILTTLLLHHTRNAPMRTANTPTDNKRSNLTQA